MAISHEKFLAAMEMIGFVLITPEFLKLEYFESDDKIDNELGIDHTVGIVIGVIVFSIFWTKADNFKIFDGIFGYIIEFVIASLIFYIVAGLVGLSLKYIAKIGQNKIVRRRMFIWGATIIIMKCAIVITAVEDVKMPTNAEMQEKVLKLYKL